MKPILCVDFDGVIHSYTSGWQGAEVVTDPPVPGALKWLWEASQIFDVQVYSSRSKEAQGRTAMMYWMAYHAAEELGKDHPMAWPDVTKHYPVSFACEKPPAFLTIDDRCIRFDGDWSKLDPKELATFKPWFQR